MAESQSSGPQPVLSRLAVKGFKSHYERTEIQFRNLTLLAGANSSGKSSIIQPLLLLKQTVDMLPMDAGPLKLDGPNVYFSDANQLLSHAAMGAASGFEIQLALSTTDTIELAFAREGSTFDIATCTYQYGGQVFTARRATNSSTDTSTPALIVPNAVLADTILRYASAEQVDRLGCYLLPKLFLHTAPRFLGTANTALAYIPQPVGDMNNALQQMLHLSGLRGNPSRAYPRVTSGAHQPGQFHERASSILASWVDHRHSRLDQLNDALARMGLAGKVEASARDATSVEVKVSRTLKGSGASDMVSVADVGFGVSQSLPVVIALIAAEPNQLVYIEQPEIHLHPRAQKVLADLIAETARRSVRLVIETHSDIILSRIQWNIARKENNLPPDQVIAHWFKRDPETGASHVRSNTPDATGAFGDWPVDFADVAAEVDREYAQAAFDRLPEDEP